MTEREWRRCGNVEQMLHYLSRKRAPALKRKLRLLPAPAAGASGTC